MCCCIALSDQPADRVSSRLAIQRVELPDRRLHQVAIEPGGPTDGIERVIGEADRQSAGPIRLAKADERTSALQ